MRKSAAGQATNSRAARWLLSISRPRRSHTSMPGSPSGPGRRQPPAPRAWELTERMPAVLMRHPRDGPERSKSPRGCSHSGSALEAACNRYSYPHSGPLDRYAESLPDFQRTTQADDFFEKVLRDDSVIPFEDEVALKFPLAKPVRH